MKAGIEQRADPALSEGGFLLPACLPACLPVSWDIGSFSAFGLELKHRFFLDLQPAGLWTGTPPLAVLVLKLSEMD